MGRYFVVICGTALLAVAAWAADSPAVKALKQNEAQWNRDYTAKDVDKLLAHYADDAVLITPGEPAVTGKDGIRAALKGLVSDPSFSLKFEAARVDVAKSGDMAYTRGSYALAVSDPATKKVIHDKGSYVTIYKKQADGSWKAVEDIVSSAGQPSQAGR